MLKIILLCIIGSVFFYGSVFILLRWVEDDVCYYWTETWEKITFAIAAISEISTVVVFFGLHALYPLTFSLFWKTKAITSITVLVLMLIGRKTVNGIKCKKQKKEEYENNVSDYNKKIEKIKVSDTKDCIFIGFDSFKKFYDLAPEQYELKEEFSIYTKDNQSFQIFFETYDDLTKYKEMLLNIENEKQEAKKKKEEKKAFEEKQKKLEKENINKRKKNADKKRFLELVKKDIIEEEAEANSCADEAAVFLDNISKAVSLKNQQHE